MSRLKSGRKAPGLALLCLFSLMLAHPASGRARESIIGIVTVNRPGDFGDGDSARPAISADGYHVAFETDATNLSDDDFNGLYDDDHNLSRDVLVQDFNVDPPHTMRVSVSTTGPREANGQSKAPAISGDGRFVAFWSSATNLVPGDTNGFRDVFLHDRNTDGNLIYDEPGKTATWRISIQAGGIQGNGTSTAPSISEDGQVIAFQTDATNFTTGDFNQQGDVWYCKLKSPLTPGDPVPCAQLMQASVNESRGIKLGESEQPAVSGDGRYIAFASEAQLTNVVQRRHHIYRYNVAAATSRTAELDVMSYGPGLREANGGSFDPAISFDGSTVIFTSAATNLVFKDPLGLVTADNNGVDDVYLRDAVRQVTKLVSVRANASAPESAVEQAQEAANGQSFRPSFSGVDACRLHSVAVPVQVSHVTAPAPTCVVVAFESDATNLVNVDTNGVTDVFIRDLGGQVTELVSQGENLEAGSLPTDGASISSDGQAIAFASVSPEFSLGDTLGFSDVFVRDRSFCSFGDRENDPVSEIIHQSEPLLARAGPTVHRYNCDVVAQVMDGQEPILPTPVP